MQDTKATAPLANTVPIACQRLGIGRTMLYSLIDRGELRVIKIGARTLVPESELQELIAGRLNAEAPHRAAKSA